MKVKFQKDFLYKVLENAPEVNILEYKKIVIFNDLHMGNGRMHDEFLKNSDMFKKALLDYYQKGFYLILNGDVEELHKFRMRHIKKRWSEIYDIFDLFQEEGRLKKIEGNHDTRLAQELSLLNKYPLYLSVKITGYLYPIFVYHGHQSLALYQRFNEFTGAFLRFIVKPLGLKNYMKSFESDRKITVEHRIYEFTRENHIISIIGHTHRPLFESLSEADQLRFLIESLLRELRICSNEDHQSIADEILRVKALFIQLSGNQDRLIQSCVYSSELPVPCLFNSGAVLGKRGMTCIELEQDQINLIHWFDDRVKKKYVDFQGGEPTIIEKSTGLKKRVLRDESMIYICNAIQLLS